MRATATVLDDGRAFRALRCPVCGEYYAAGARCAYPHEPWECCHLHDRPIMARGRWWTAADTWAVMSGEERHGGQILPGRRTASPDAPYFDSKAVRGGVISPASHKVSEGE